MRREVRTGSNAFWESFLAAHITTDAQVDGLGLVGKNLAWHANRNVLVDIARRCIEQHGWDHAKVAFKGLPDSPGPVLCLYAAADRGAELRALWCATEGLVGGWEWKTDAETAREFARGTHPTQTARRRILVEAIAKGMHDG
jgi:hypothetical protein